MDRYRNDRKWETNWNIQQLTLEMYKVTKGLEPTATTIPFLQCSNNRHTRPQLHFPVPQINTVCCSQNSIRYLGPLSWNLIPTALSNVESFVEFKSLIKKLENIILPMWVMQRLYRSSWFCKCNSVSDIKW